jgi:hypothetical protein
MATTQPSARRPSRDYRRLFLLRYHDSLLWPPQKPTTTTAAATDAATDGTWYLLRADSPFPAFNHQRCVLSGYTNPEPGPRTTPAANARPARLRPSGLGSLADMLARAAQLEVIIPRPTPDIRVTTMHMPRCNRIGLGGWDIPPKRNKYDAAENPAPQPNWLGRPCGNSLADGTGRSLGTQIRRLKVPAHATRDWRVGRRRAWRRAVSASDGQGCQLVRPSVQPGPPTRLLGKPMRADPGRSSPASAARSCCRHAALKIKKA